MTKTGEFQATKEKASATSQLKWNQRACRRFISLFTSRWQDSRYWNNQPELALTKRPSDVSNLEMDLTALPLQQDQQPLPEFLLQAPQPLTLPSLQNPLLAVSDLP